MFFCQKKLFNKKINNTPFSPLAVHHHRLLCYHNLNCIHHTRICLICIHSNKSPTGNTVHIPNEKYGCGFAKPNILMDSRDRAKLKASNSPFPPPFFWCMCTLDCNWSSPPPLPGQAPGYQRVTASTNVPGKHHLQSDLRYSDFYLPNLISIFLLREKNKKKISFFYSCKGRV